jgi:hypothetical protein
MLFMILDSDPKVNAMQCIQNVIVNNVIDNDSVL